tara:strand:+ start:274 stop:537 length:264 start_codon:yes stop_codon:yes gene_type:complete
VVLLPVVPVALLPVVPVVPRWAVLRWVRDNRWNGIQNIKLSLGLMPEYFLGPNSRVIQKPYDHTKLVLKISKLHRPLDLKTEALLLE